jgi:hypothetical protein
MIEFCTASRQVLMVGNRHSAQALPSSPMHEGRSRNSNGYSFRIYPPAQPVTYKPGDVVYVALKSDKSTGRGKVIAHDSGLPHNSTDGAEQDRDSSAVVSTASCEHIHATCAKQPETTVSTTRQAHERVMVHYDEGGTASARCSRLTSVRTACLPNSESRK